MYLEAYKASGSIFTYVHCTVNIFICERMYIIQTISHTSIKSKHTIIIIDQLDIHSIFFQMNEEKLYVDTRYLAMGYVLFSSELL